MPVAGKEPGRALQTMRPIGTKDGFALEHRAWYYASQGDAERASRELQRFVDRGDHVSGRNLTNFLQGLVLILKGRDCCTTGC